MHQIETHQKEQITKTTTNGNMFISSSVYVYSPSHVHADRQTPEWADLEMCISSECNRGRYLQISLNSMLTQMED